MKISSIAVVLLVGFSNIVRANDLAPEGSNSVDAATVALVDAAEKGDFDQVRSLVEKGTPIEGFSGKYRTTALIAAADSGNLEIVKYLLSKGANPDAQDSEGSTALLHACWTDHADCALALLEGKADPNLGSRFGRFPLMYAANRGNDVIIAALIAHQVDLNSNCNEGPAVYWAVASKNYSTLKLLIEKGADLKLLCKKRVNPNDFNATLLGVAASNDETEMMQLMLDHGVGVDTAADTGDTPLMNAAENDAVQGADFLLAKGAAVDRQNKRGMTALMIASQYAGDNFLQHLINQHAQLDLKDNLGRTALMMACASDAVGTAMILLKAGAEINATDNRGETALTVAGDLGNAAIVELLKRKNPKNTELHIIPKGDPEVPLSDAEAWSLAVGAVYSQRNGLNHNYLGGNDDSPKRARELLSKSWGIRDKATFLTELGTLVGEGDRVGYQQQGAALAALSDAEFQRVLVKNPAEAVQKKALRDSYLRWGKRSGLAGDLCRASMLVNNAVSARYLTEDEGWDRLYLIAHEVQQDFKSWQEMSDNFIDARKIWAAPTNPDFELCAKLLLNDKDPNSPWTKLPWNTVLPP